LNTVAHEGVGDGVVGALVGARVVGADVGAATGAAVVGAVGGVVGPATTRLVSTVYLGSAVCVCNHDGKHKHCVQA
jgi:hypothetical protein